MGKKDRSRRPAGSRTPPKEPDPRFAGPPLEVWERLKSERSGLGAQELLQQVARTGGAPATGFLVSLCGEGPSDVRLAAVGALPLVGTRAAAEALQAVLAAEAGTALGEAAVVGLRALKARGIRVDVPEDPDAPVTERRFRLMETWGSLPDAVGSRQLFARLQDQYGRWRTLVAIWNDRAGLKQAYDVPISGRDWARHCQEWSAAGVITVKVPEDYARWELAQALALNATTGLEVPEGHLDWERLVGPPPEAYRPPDSSALIAGATSEEIEERASHSRCVMGHPGLRSWALEPADVIPWRERAVEVYRQDDDQEIEDLLTMVADSAFDAEQVGRYRGRLEECALKFQWLRRRHEAEVSAAIVALLDRGATPGSIPLFRGMIENSFQFLEEILEDDDDPEALRYDPLVDLEPGQD